MAVLPGMLFGTSSRVRLSGTCMDCFLMRFGIFLSLFSLCLLVIGTTINFRNFVLCYFFRFFCNNKQIL
jgi:hypothetical protein